VDPDGGSRFARGEEIARSFTGVALLVEPAPNFESRASGSSPLWAHARRIAVGSGLIGRTLTTSILLQLFAVALPLVTGVVVDRIVPSRDASLLGVLTAGIAAIALYAFLASYVRSHLLLALRTQLDFQMTAGFLRHLLRLPFSFFQLRHTGDLLLRLDSNAVIRESLTSAVMSGVIDGFLVTGYLAVILVTDWRLGIVVVALGMARVGVFLATRRRYRELMGESLQAQADSSSYQVQMIEGIETLKTSGAERRAVELWTNLFVQVLNVSIRRGRLTALVDASVGICPKNERSSFDSRSTAQASIQELSIRGDRRSG
jgi:ABC-type bacteriocin/lantibiotic exporter with double-glycine peptidase domain